MIIVYRNTQEKALGSKPPSSTLGKNFKSRRLARNVEFLHKEIRIKFGRSEQKKIAPTFPQSELSNFCANCGCQKCEQVRLILKILVGVGPALTLHHPLIPKQEGMDEGVQFAV